MGCVCGKPSLSDSEDCPRQRELNLRTTELRVARAASDIRVESFSPNDELEKNLDTRKDEKGKDLRCFSTIGNIPRATEGEQVAAGWPSWLATVAGEAINGWVPRKLDSFEKLDKIGQGTYSTVYKGRDLVNNKLVALKKVKFDNMDPESVKFMAREILILRNLDHPNVIKLEGLITSRTSCNFYLVFEYMEHDLTGLSSLPGVKFTESQVKCYMHQLLSGLDYCHSHGVLHRDIKGSNLLIDNQGILKIADFGLASYFDHNNCKIKLTSRVVTLWYRPPELLLGATHYGVAVDLWSTGCMLGELFTGRPIMAGRTEVEQLHKIFKLCGSPSEDYWKKSKLPHSPGFSTIQPYKQMIVSTFKDLPDAAIKLMQTLLSVEPSERGTASSALQSEFFKTEPLACDPSCLPKYPPSKEIDAKFREEESRRQGVPGVKGQQKCEIPFKTSKQLRSAAAPVSTAFSAAEGREKLILEGREKLILSLVEGANQVCSNTRRSELFRDPTGKLGDRRGHSQRSEIMNKRESAADGRGHRERKAAFSGPLHTSSNNIEQVLKEHNHRIQAAARRIRNEKMRVGRIRPQNAR